MKFKNYRNSYTKDNRIYSKQEMLEMPIREFKDRAEEFVAQHEVLGLPDESELRDSSNVIWIEEYTKDDGTKVSGHWRSKPGGGESGGKPEDILTGGAAEIMEENVENNNNFEKPVEGKITSDFGYRIAPTKGASTGHSGIDIGVPVGTPVKSIADGTVVAANGGMRGYGNGVFVDHGIINGKHVVSEYGHLSEFGVKVGDKVRKGQEIAKSGNTGISTGPHLHLTVREDKMPVDPKKYVKY